MRNKATTLQKKNNCYLSKELYQNLLALIEIYYAILLRIILNMYISLMRHTKLVRIFEVNVS